MIAGLEATTPPESSAETATAKSTATKTTAEAGSAHTSHANGRNPGDADQVGADRLQRRLDFRDGRR
jgi:hypothetical protein